MKLFPFETAIERAAGLLGLYLALPAFKPDNRIGPGRCTILNDHKREHLSDKERAWRARGQQPDSRECRRRARQRAAVNAVQ